MHKSRLRGAGNGPRKIFRQGAIPETEVRISEKIALGLKRFAAAEWMAARACAPLATLKSSDWPPPAILLAESRDPGRAIPLSPEHDPEVALPAFGGDHAGKRILGGTGFLAPGSDLAWRQAMQLEEGMPAPARVEATAEAVVWIERLKHKHGPLMFYLSSGCCEGSSPMCFTDGDYRLRDDDVLLGEIGGCPFYLSARQFEYWRHTQMILDVTPGQGSGFSLEAPEGVSFLTRGRVFSDAEVAELAVAGEPPRAA